MTNEPISTQPNAMSSTAAQLDPHGMMAAETQPAETAELNEAELEKIAGGGLIWNHNQNSAADLQQAPVEVSPDEINNPAEAEELNETELETVAGGGLAWNHNQNVAA